MPKFIHLYGSISKRWPEEGWSYVEADTVEAAAAAIAARQQGSSANRVILFSAPDCEIIEFEMKQPPPLPVEQWEVTKNVVEPESEENEEEDLYWTDPTVSHARTARAKVPTTKSRTR